MSKKVSFANSKIRLSILIFLILALTTSLCPMPASAAGAQVVRLGYYIRPGFQEGSGPDERKSGYAYEYLQKISDYTGWKYEYIYEDFDTLKEMMSRGEVDLIAGFSHNDVIPDVYCKIKMVLPHLLVSIQRYDTSA